MPVTLENDFGMTKTSYERLCGRCAPRFVKHLQVDAEEAGKTFLVHTKEPNWPFVPRELYDIRVDTIERRGTVHTRHGRDIKVRFSSLSVRELKKLRREITQYYAKRQADPNSDINRIRRATYLAGDDGPIMRTRW